MQYKLKNSFKQSAARTSRNSRDLLPWASPLILVLAAIAISGLSGCQTSQLGSHQIPAPPSSLPHDFFQAAPQQNAVSNEAPSGYSGHHSQTPFDPSSNQNSHLVRYQSPQEDIPKQRSIKSLLSRDMAREEVPTLAVPGADLSLESLKQDPALPAEPGQLVRDVIIKGNKRVPTHHLTRNISTRVGRYYDPDRLQEDVDKLWRMPEISRVNGPFIEPSAEGYVITIEVLERNVINEIKFLGNRGLTDRKLLKESGLEEGGPMDIYQIKMARDRIEELYKTKGFPRTQVELLEGNETDDASVVFLIHEDQKQRIWKAEFEGNQIASDARLRSFIESKPGYFKVFGGLVKRDEIDQDILKLTNYYRSLGFFNARIGREIAESNDGRWMTIRFIINEGPRYRVRNVSFVGNQVYQSDQLDGLLKLKPNENGSPEFNSAKMNADVVALRDLYGSQGYVFANVEAEPRFLEEPGLLDIVYKVSEGKQYRAGDINVYFEGNNGITRREVALNRISVRPGDIIDVREIRNSERRLGSAQIFADQTTGSQGPRIKIRPPELKDLERQAKAGSLMD